MRHHEQDYLDNVYASAVVPLIDRIINDSGPIDNPDDPNGLAHVLDAVHAYMRSYNFVAIQQAFDTLGVQIQLVGLPLSPIDRSQGIFCANEVPGPISDYYLYAAYKQGLDEKFIFWYLKFTQEENNQRLRGTGRYAFVGEGSMLAGQLHARDN